jgi:hypothetical protein
MSDTAHSWADGTPRSQGNAFSIPPRPTAEADAANEKIRLRNLARHDQKLKAQGRTRADVQKKAATRINREASLAAFIPNSKTAPR